MGPSRNICRWAARMLLTDQAGEIASPIGNAEWGATIRRQVPRRDSSPIASRVGFEFSIHIKLRSEEHTSELQSLMRISYAVFCLKKKTNTRDDKSKQTRQHIDNKPIKQCVHA